MTFLDRWLQKRRIRKAVAYIPKQSVLLDIGCNNGELFTQLGDNFLYGVGIDPILNQDVIRAKYELLKDTFPSKRAETKIYHCITMLAVLEHIPPAVQADTINTCYKLLHKEGVMILTVPNKKVDRILMLLKMFRLVKGMQLEEHFGFDTSAIPKLFTNAGFELVMHKKFQFGLNNLYVFKK